MGIYTNQTNAPLIFPTLANPDGSLVELQPGESCEIPDPAPPADVYDPASHTITDVMSWVGGDLDRAALALAAEEQSARPRPTLITQLADLIKPADTDTEA